MCLAGPAPTTRALQHKTLYNLLLFFFMLKETVQGQKQNENRMKMCSTSLLKANTERSRAQNRAMEERANFKEDTEH